MQDYGRVEYSQGNKIPGSDLCGRLVFLFRRYHVPELQDCIRISYGTPHDTRRLMLTLSVERHLFNETRIPAGAPTLNPAFLGCGTVVYGNWLLIVISLSIISDTI